MGRLEDRYVELEVECIMSDSPYKYIRDVVRSDVRQMFAEEVVEKLREFGLSDEEIDELKEN